MPKISDKTRNKLAGEVVGLLADRFPLPLSTRAVAEELIRDKEFALKILKFCEEKGYVKRTGRPKGGDYRKWLKWTVTPEARQKLATG
ncbi:MAG: hypothetical protein AABW54_00695 [Candidatus Micrarchaeota archaeon]